MKKLIKNILMMAALVCGTMSLTSCDEIMESLFGEWDKPTPETPTPDPESTVTTIELTTADLTAEQKAETAALLAAARFWNKDWRAYSFYAYCNFMKGREKYIFIYPC